MKVLNGEIVSCIPPTDKYGDPLRTGTAWQCECGVIWVAGSSRWHVQCRHLWGWKSRSRRNAMKRHLRWVEDQRRAESLRAALTPTDREWLASVKVSPTER